MTAKNQIAWSRISALKPVRRAAETPVVDACPSLASADSGRLEHLLGAEVLKNNFGEFISSRQWFADAAPQEIPHSALRILAPKQIDQLELLADARNWLFLDTETTGLAGGTGTYAFLIGLAWWDANGLQVEQLFMRDYAEEHAVLLALTERLAERRVLVTFNGRSFDWPLLETRYRMTRKLSPPAHAAHLDLLHPARHVWRLRLGSVRLSELEKYVLGFERGPDLWSAMIPEIYFEYLRRGEVAAKPLVEVFRHNSMDLRGLAGLAVKFFELLKEPESAEADPLDLCGLSRLLRSRGPDYSTGARALYERSLAAGLPGALDRAARRELAVLAKRDKDYSRAADLWGDITGTHATAGFDPAQTNEEVERDDVWSLEAYEQLAIYYERRAKQPERAAQLTRDALLVVRRVQSERSPAALARVRQRLESRLARLSRHRDNLSPPEVSSTLPLGKS